LPRLPRRLRQKRVLVPLGLAVAAVLAALGAALALHYQTRSAGRLITTFPTVTLKTFTTTTPPPRPRTPPKRPVVAETCWNNFGGDPERTLARAEAKLGRPHKVLWARGLHDLMEYPPSFCQGRLYVNLERGRTVALDARTGHVLWSHRWDGFTASTPAIAGPRLIVSSHAGLVSALMRTNGRLLWQLHTDAPVESSPVVVNGVVYVGAADGKLYALDVRTGRPRWVYDTGGRISSSPSVVRGRVCITTYSGLIACLKARTGERLWADWIRRDFVRYDSFYASPSSDGVRIFTVSREGRLLALSLASGRILWTYNVGTTAYGTPAVANGRVFVGDLGGTLTALRTTTGARLWSTRAAGSILAPALVVGNLVFFSTLNGHTYAARTIDGRIVWQLGLGKYAPGIATNRRYFLSLNGLLVSYLGSLPLPGEQADSPPAAARRKPAKRR
jgi:outer membrane protein assembly factor BamB